MVKIAATIEHHASDALFLRPLGHAPADFFRRGHIAAGSGSALFGRAGRHDGDALRIVNDLRVDVSHAAEHGETGLLGGAADLAPDALVNAPADFVFGDFAEHLLLTSCRAALTDLLAQHFAGITDALVLVRIGLAKRADIGRHLAEQLLIEARENQVGLLIDFEID